MKQFNAFVIILIVLFAAPKLFAECTSIVSGTIVAQTWTQENSPYCVANDILVNSLTIEPGVRVEFLGDYEFEVVGILTAIGSEESPIVFTTEESNTDGWQGIFLNQSFPDTELSYCKVEYSHNSGIRIFDTSPVIHLCEISNNTALHGAGINISGSEPVTLLDCIIRKNGYEGRHPRGGGIYTTTALTMIRCGVSENTIIDRHSSCWDGDATTLGGGIYSTTDLILQNVLVSGNVASSIGGGENSRGGGVYSAGPLSCYNSSIGNNSASAGGCNLGGRARGYGGGIYVGSTVSMENCIITNNYTRTSGGGIYAESDAQGTIENCTIIYDNSPGGISVAGNSVNLVNSILYFNSSYQASGNLDITYSNVQGCMDGEGNICEHPLLIPGLYNRIPENSPCVDKGNPDPVYNDVCFPPSLGTERNDMGAHGGPSGCDWSIDGITRYQCITKLGKSLIKASVLSHVVGDLTYYWMPLDGGDIVGEGSNVEFYPPDPGDGCASYEIALMMSSTVPTELFTPIIFDVHVRELPGDSNGDGVVNVIDKVTVRNNFGKTSDDPNWDYRADVNFDDVVNIIDKVVVRNQFGDAGCGCPSN